MQLTFEESYKRLKEINEIIKSENIIDIDKLISLQNEAKILYDYCQKIIKKTNENK